MKARYELVDPSVNARKFWEIEYPAGVDTAFRTSWGRIGNEPASKVKKWPTAAKARAEAKKITARKEREGYKPVSKGSEKRPPKAAGTEDVFYVVADFDVADDNDSHGFFRVLNHHGNQLVKDLMKRGRLTDGAHDVLVIPAEVTPVEAVRSALKVVSVKGGAPYDELADDSLADLEDRFGR